MKGLIKMEEKRHSVRTPEGIKHFTDEEYAEYQAINNEMIEDDRTYSDKRRERILEEYPIEDQLEAITENAMGRPDKLTSLIAGIEQIKAEIPKEEEATTE